MGLASGTQLGQYEIAAPLGKGGMGEVFRARDTKLERDVAITADGGSDCGAPVQIRITFSVLRARNASLSRTVAWRGVARWLKCVCKTNARW